MQETAARAIVERGYVVFSANTSVNNETGKKVMNPPKKWQDSTLVNCLSSKFFNPRDNTLLINTAPSGVLVVDFDLQDGGMEQLAEWESKHGAFTGPRVGTGSGGAHLYFSHERSMESGLEADTPTHFAKLELKSRDPGTRKETLKKVGADMRGVSSNGMITCPPSFYQRCEEIARYTVAGGGDLPAVDALPPLPGWFIEILNEWASSKAAGVSKSRPRAGKAAAAGAGIRQASASVKSPDLADAVLQQSGRGLAGHAQQLRGQHLYLQQGRSEHSCRSCMGP